MSFFENTFVEFDWFVDFDYEKKKSINSVKKQ